MLTDKTQRGNAGFGKFSPANFNTVYQYLIADDIAEAQTHLDDLPESQRRGLTLETLRHFHCGYLKSWVLTKSRAQYACGTYTKDDGTPKKLPPPSERIIIPTSTHHFNAVATPRARCDMDKNFVKQHAGTMELFCDPAALDADTLVVVEGEMDCMSIHQATSGKIPVIAILGCGNQDKTIGENLAGILKGKRFVIMFDGDAAGRANAKKLRDRLIWERVPAVIRHLPDYLPLDMKKDSHAAKIDANELLCYHGEERLMTTMQQALATTADDLDRVAAQIAQDVADAGTTDANPQLEIISTARGKRNSDATRDARYQNVNYSDDPDDDLSIARAAMWSIPLDDASRVTRGDWFMTGCVWKIHGGTFEEFDAWSKTDPARYDPVDCRAQWDSMWTAEQAGDKGYRLGTLINFAKQFGYQPPRKKLTADEIIADIRRRCDWKFDSKKRPVAIKATQANLNLIFSEDPNLSKLFGYDRFQGAIVFLKKAPWHSDESGAGDLWHDTDAAELRNYIRTNYAELRDKQGIEDTVIRFANENSFNAVKVFLESLPKWDGTPRAENLFVKFLHAEDSGFTREVTLKWLLGTIARVYHPGCDFQICLVLQGAQRIGKSKLVKMLGGKERVNPNGQNWHVALKDSVDDAHAVDALQKGWIIEIEEFSAARKAEINALKTFISADDDTRRFSYDKFATTRKRHVAFVVTCNDEQFLRDPTGNARFIIIKCSQKKFDRVAGMTPEYIRQVWAEVYQRYQELFADGFDESKLQLELETQIHAEEIAERYLQDDGLTGEVKAFVDKKKPTDVIWRLMSKDDRRKFFVDGKFTIEEGDLDARFKNSGRITPDKQAAFDKAKQISPSVRRVNISQGGGMPCYLTFYGSELREHICAAEIFNEAIPNGDKRKQMYRIEEILSHLDGWTLSKRLQKADPEYPDQRKPYFRNPDNRPADEPATNPADDLTSDSESVDNDDLPL